MLYKQKNRGFTLIEVTIILALAAIIIMVIFFAVTHAQKSQRDKARKDLAIQLTGQVTQYASNTGENFTGFSCASYCQDIQDPDNVSGKPVAGSAGSRATRSSGLVYAVGSICGAGGSSGQAVGGVAGSNTYAILYWSEVTNSSNCLDGSGGSSVAGSIITTPLAGGSGSSGGGAFSGGIYAVSGGAIASCEPDISRCLNYGGGGIYTAWAPTRFTYDISDLSTGDHNMQIFYRNSANLPASYSQFNVNLYIDGVRVLENQKLPIGTNGVAPGPYESPITVPDGAKNLSVEWTNDWCCGPGQDANFVLSSFFMN